MAQRGAGQSRGGGHVRDQGGHARDQGGRDQGGHARDQREPRGHARDQGGRDQGGHRDQGRRRADDAVPDFRAEAKEIITSATMCTTAYALASPYYRGPPSAREGLARYREDVASKMKVLAEFIARARVSQLDASHQEKELAVL
eukprot:244827-Pyramimonas_sp.AAC.1